MAHIDSTLPGFEWMATEAADAAAAAEAAMPDWTREARAAQSAARKATAAAAASATYLPADDARYIFRDAVLTDIPQA